MPGVAAPAECSSGFRAVLLDTNDRGLHAVQDQRRYQSSLRQCVQVAAPWSCNLCNRPKLNEHQAELFVYHCNSHGGC